MLRRGSSPPSRPIGYDGVCSICGHVGRFETESAKLVDRSFRCLSCSATLRVRNEASVVLEEIGRGRHLSMTSLVRDDRVQALSVYNVGVSGPLRRRLKELPDYTESSTHQGRPGPGDGRNASRGPPPAHLRRRILRPDHQQSRHGACGGPGASVPGDLPCAQAERALRLLGPRRVASARDVRVRCAIVDGKLVHYLKPAYHTSPSSEPTLVFTDFGTDVLDLLERHRVPCPSHSTTRIRRARYRNSLFVATKPTAAWGRTYEGDEPRPDLDRG